MENASKALIIAGAVLIAILLISMGVILVNSGKDVTSIGQTGMKSSEIQTFNAQFTPYEGIHTGSELTSLISAIRANNATNEEHQIEGNWESATLQPTKRYEVTLVTSDKGYIDQIWIDE